MMDNRHGVNRGGICILSHHVDGNATGNALCHQGSRISFNSAIGKQMKKKQIDPKIFLINRVIRQYYR
jgi:hypothetical protein